MRVEELNREVFGATPAGAEIITAPSVAVPTYEARVAACTWIHINEVIELDTRKHAAIVDAGLFRVHVLGDCMEPRFHDGDVVEFRIVRLDKEPWPQGEDCIVITSDDEVTLKRIYHVGEDSITLYALNWRKYPDPIVVPRQMVTRVAVALKVVSDPPKVAFKPMK